jgi:hypothetical protein
MIAALLTAGWPPVDHRWTPVDHKYNTLYKCVY